MRRWQPIAIVMSALLVTANVVVGSNLSYNDITDEGPNLQQSGENPPIMHAPPLPSTIRLWEAWAKGYATVVQGDTTYIVTNNGTSSVLIDEYIVLMSPSPSNPSEDIPGINDETQDGVLTPINIVSPGSSLDFNYGLFLTPPLWWCLEDTEFILPGISITLGGEILPYDMIDIAENPYVGTQYELWNYMDENSTLVIGKLPLWEEIANIGDEVDITLDITNIGFQDATNVVVTDTIPPGYSFDPSSFTRTPSSITSNPDGSVTIEWSISHIDAGVKTPNDEPTIYTTVYIGYKLITPELAPDLRIFLPRAYVDKNGDGVDDAESEEPLLETYFVNRPPVAVVDDFTVFEGTPFTLDGTDSYDPDEPYGDFITSYEWDTDGDGVTDEYGPTVSMVYGDDGIYYVNLTVTDNNGANSQDIIVTTVQNIAPFGKELLVNGHFSDGLTGWHQRLHGYVGAGSYNYLPPEKHSTSTAKGFLESGAEDGYNYLYQDVEVDSMNLDFSARLRALQFSADGGLVSVLVSMYDDKPPDMSGNPPSKVNADAAGNMSLGHIFWYVRPDHTYTSTETMYYERLDTNPSGWLTVEANLHDIIATHLPGVDESEVEWLRIQAETYGETTELTIGQYDDYSLREPVVLTPSTSFEGGEVLLTANVTDLGSDDLTLTFDWDDGSPPEVRIYLNDIAGSEPVYDPTVNEIRSPWGTYPFEVEDTFAHVYGDNGEYTVTLTITDDDGGTSIVSTNITVLNVDPELMNINVTILENAPRTQGYWNHQCRVIIPYGDHTGILQEWIDEIGVQSQVFAGISSKDEVCSILDPDDRSNMLLKAKQQLMALWLNVVSSKLYPESPLDLPGLTSSKTVGEAIDEIETVILTISDKDELERVKDIADNINNFIGVPEKMASITAEVQDAGSDDLIFTWSVGYTNEYYNDGVNPDPYPSPWGTYPFEADDTIMVPYTGSYTITLTILDDDAGFIVETINLV